MSHSQTEQWIESQYELYQEKLNKMDDEGLEEEWLDKLGSRTEFKEILHNKGSNFVVAYLLDKFTERITR